MICHRGNIFAVGSALNLQAVYSQLIENRHLFTEVRLEGGCVYAEWDGEDSAMCEIPTKHIPSVSRLFPRVRFGTVWGCPSLFIRYGVYAAGIEEVGWGERIDTPDQVDRFLQRAYAIVEGHLNHALPEWPPEATSPRVS